MDVIYKWAPCDFVSFGLSCLDPVKLNFLLSILNVKLLLRCESAGKDLNVNFPGIVLTLQSCGIQLRTPTK